MSDINDKSINQSIVAFEEYCISCGGSLVHLQSTKYQCTYCKSVRYLEKYTDDEKELLRQANYDRIYRKQYGAAMDGYEIVLKTNQNNKEALWGMFLAEYGIEYILDYDKTYKPTFHCLSSQPVQENKHYKKAISLSVGEEKSKYIADAREIEKIRLKMLENIDKNKSYDIFICYKKNKPDGKSLTPESAWAQDYWVEFKSMGFNVFWSEKEIEGEYEPSIYNALTTAKFMIILCTDAEYLNSAWVINEWSRFLRRKKEDDPSIDFCVVCDNVEPYDLPRALQQNQALSHSKATCFESLKGMIARAFKDKGNLSQIKLDTVEIKGGEVARRAARVKVEQIQKAQLGGTYNIGEVSLSDENRIQSVQHAVEKGNFAYALELICSELFPAHENNYKVLLLKLYAEAEVRSGAEFWKDLCNLSHRKSIDCLLKCATKEFAEDFINNWIKLLSSHNDDKAYLECLEYLVQYDVSSRNLLINAAQKQAESGLNHELISIVERCLDNNDTDRFVNFYFRIAQNLSRQGSRKDLGFYKKVLEIDEGHHESLMGIFRINYFYDNEDPEKTVFGICAHAEFENICRFVSQEQREEYLDEIIDKLLEQCNKNKKEFDQNTWYYLSLYNKDGANFKAILCKIFTKLIDCGFWSLAEKYCALTITLNESDEWLYFRLLQIKLHCYNPDQIATVEEPKIRTTDEFKQAYKLAGEHKNNALLELLEDLAAKQFDNISKNNIMPLNPEENDSLESYYLEILNNSTELCDFVDNNASRSEGAIADENTINLLTANDTNKCAFRHIGGKIYEAISDGRRYLEYGEMTVYDTVEQEEEFTEDYFVEEKVKKLFGTKTVSVKKQRTAKRMIEKKIPRQIPRCFVVEELEKIMEAVKQVAIKAEIEKKQKAVEDMGRKKYETRSLTIDNMPDILTYFNSAIIGIDRDKIVAFASALEKMQDILFDETSLDNIHNRRTIHDNIEIIGAKLAIMATYSFQYWTDYSRKPWSFRPYSVDAIEKAFGQLSATDRIKELLNRPLEKSGASEKDIETDSDLESKIKMISEDSSEDVTINVKMAKSLRYTMADRLNFTSQNRQSSLADGYVGSLQGILNVLNRDDRSNNIEMYKTNLENFLNNIENFFFSKYYIAHSSKKYADAMLSNS